MQAQKGPPAAQTRADQSEAAPGTAFVRFRHSPHGSGVSRSGNIRPGKWLRVEYDPARLPPSSETPVAADDIVCHVQFFPHGKRHSGSVPGPGGLAAQPGRARQAPFEVRVPSDATRVELWFETQGSTGTSSWDSRHGQNYSFVVTGEGLPVPEPAVALRAGALVDAAAIQVVEDAATKATSRIGSGGRRLHSGLVIRALVADTSTVSDAWADIHIFDAADELIHANSVPLQPADPGVQGAPLVWEDDVYEGSGGGSGVGVWSRPDAHTIQYRVYCRVKGPAATAQLFTDGVLHEFELPADEDVGAVPG